MSCPTEPACRTNRRKTEGLAPYRYMKNENALVRAKCRDPCVQSALSPTCAIKGNIAYAKSSRFLIGIRLAHLTGDHGGGFGVVAKSFLAWIPLKLAA